MPGSAGLDWVVLTRGDRPLELDTALRSIHEHGESHQVSVIVNGARLTAPPSSPVRVVQLDSNLGVAAGRDVGFNDCEGPVVGFLDDDACLQPGSGNRIARAFNETSRLGAVALRVVDEYGRSADRHVPRPRGYGADASGEVATFPGGACAIRRSAYDDVGGYFADLFYGHEEIELSWRLIDRGWSIRYLADATVFHPRTEIARHQRGWELTGRNRVLIARRTLPWPIAIIHVSLWWLLGLWRAPDRANRRAYVRGWLAGWAHPVERHPIRWSTVWRLTRVGRPPLI